MPLGLSQGIVTFVLDFSFQWGLPTAILDIGQPITGAIAAIIFLSPLGNRFAPAVHSNSHAPKP